MLPKKNASVSWEQIATSVTNAILERRLAPGVRIGEEELAAVFQVSRTVVRQALAQLASRGIVMVRPKKGWFIVEPTEGEVRDVFAARRLIQCALVRELASNATHDQMQVLWEHLQRQRNAIAEEDVAGRTYLLNEFDVQIARLTGNQLMTRITADLTMRTILISMLYQTTQEASASADEHEQVLKAIKERRADEAARLMNEHLRNVEAALQERKNLDPVRRLQETLSWHPAPEPVAAARPSHSQQPQVGHSS